MKRSEAQAAHLRTSAAREQEAGTSTPSYAIMGLGRAARTTERKEDVQHPPRVWVDPAFAEESLERLVTYYNEYLLGRSSPAAEGTRQKYHKTLLSFTRSLEHNGQPLLLSSLTPQNANKWVMEQRQAGNSEDGIASRLAALKAFSHKYVYKHLELTTCDLLEKVPRITPPAKPFPKLTEEEQARILDCFDRPTFTDRRDKAMMAMYLATGRRYSEIRSLRLSDLDQVSGEFAVVQKGGSTILARLSPRALKLVKQYLKERPRDLPTDALWVTDEGTPLAEGGVRAIFRRLKKRSGVERIHPHLFRHHFAQRALEKGAERALVQDLLGHSSDLMSRRYAGSVRQTTAAKRMPEYSPL